MCLMDWAEDPSRASLGINYPALVSRLRHGWSVERTLTTPIPSKGAIAGGNHFVKTIKVLPFHFYPFPGAIPIICEIDDSGYVYMSHNDQVLHRDKYSGVFVPLVEMHPYRGDQEGENYGSDHTPQQDGVDVPHKSA
jgi:hypothetical protein